MLATVVAMALCCGTAQADTRAVGPDGNLWSADPESGLLRITPDGDTDRFDINGVSESIAGGPGEDLTLVTRPRTSLGGATTVWRIGTDGSPRPESFVLRSEMDLVDGSSRDLRVGGGGTTWISQGWAPCRGNAAGNLTSIDATGSLGFWPGALKLNQLGAYPQGPIAVDGADRAWVEAYYPYDERCVGSRPTEWSGAMTHLIIEDGKILHTRCKWGTPVTIVATDGAAWCFGGDRYFRMDVDGAVTEYDYPGGWSDPDHARPGPDGSIWFAMHTAVGENGAYVHDWEIASITPEGELVTYPGFDQELTQKADRLNGYITLFDWRFTGDGRIWLLEQYRSKGNPLAGIIAVPEGQSQGLLPSRASSFPQPEVDKPLPDPRPQKVVPDPTPSLPTAAPPGLRVSITKSGGLSRARLRRTRTIPVTVHTSARARVTVRASITDRHARLTRLRSKRSRNRVPHSLGRATIRPVSGIATVNIKLSRKQAKRLSSRPGKITLQATAVRASGMAGFTRRLRLR